MTARDELLNLHRPLVEDARQQPVYHDNTVTAIYGYSEGVEHALDTAWAKGYRKPRTITTVEELRTLGPLSVVLYRNDGDGRFQSYVIADDGSAFPTLNGEGDLIFNDWAGNYTLAADMPLPLTLTWEP